MRRGWETMWDRWVILGLALFIGAQATWRGWRRAAARNWLGAWGAWLLALMAVTPAAVLVALGPATGR